MKIITRNKKLLFVSIAVLAVLGTTTIVFLANRTASEKTYPLGSQLEYVGQTGYGCWLVCDSNPNAIYYYGTDMDIAAVIKYFQKATIVKEPRNVNGQIYFGIKTPSGGTIYTNYYTNKNDIYKSNPSLKLTKKLYVLEIPNFKYEVAKQSL